MEENWHHRPWRRAFGRGVVSGSAASILSAAMLAACGERLLGARRRYNSTLRHMAEAGGMSAAAYVVDYHFTPRRFSPGFEKYLGPGAMIAVYAAFATGLALTQLLRDRERKRPGF